MDIIDIYRAFYPQTVAYIFFSSAHGTFSRIDHILGHRNSLNKYKRVEIIPTIFSDHNALKLEINCKKENCKNHKYMEIKQHATEKYPGQERKKKRDQEIHRNK